MTIPKTLHFCFGFSTVGGDWSLVHYACIKSALGHIKPEQATLYFEYSPNGPFWERTQKIINCERIRAPREIFGKHLAHYAHRADVFRLEKLLEVGGIYLDCDVLVHRDFDDLLQRSSVVMGKQDDGGLCNAVILAEPEAPFLRRWHSEYRSFRSKGLDQFWDEHSVRLPLKLAEGYSDELTVLDPRAFFRPWCDPDGLKKIFTSSEPIEKDGVYANHLWESKAWFPHLRDLTPGRVRAEDSNFHNWIRPLVADLPDDFGSRSIGARTRSRLITWVGQGHLRWYGEIFLLQAKHKVRLSLRALRNRSRMIDRIVGRRHTYLDRAIEITAGALGPHFEPVSHIHRRRTFQAIYRNSLWGAEPTASFFSGVGSRGQHAKAYIKALSPLLAEHARDSTEELVIVDLGCGDFSIGSALIRPLTGVRYIGCDIVPELIVDHQKKFLDKKIEFRAIDIVKDMLPDGDVCLLRQVLQHLSNKEIGVVLPKLAKYRHVYVSEAQPLVRQGEPNPDKLVGAEVRFNWKTGGGRGVELELPPWNLKVREVARSESTGAVKEMIITYKILSFVSNYNPTTTRLTLRDLLRNSSSR